MIVWDYFYYHHKLHEKGNQAERFYAPCTLRIAVRYAFVFPVLEASFFYSLSTACALVFWHQYDFPPTSDDFDTIPRNKLVITQVSTRSFLRLLL